MVVLKKKSIIKTARLGSFSSDDVDGTGLNIYLTQRASSVVARSNTTMVLSMMIAAAEEDKDEAKAESSVIVGAGPTGLVAERGVIGLDPIDQHQHMIGLGTAHAHLRLRAHHAAAADRHTGDIPQ